VLKEEGDVGGRDAGGGVVGGRVAVVLACGASELRLGGDRVAGCGDPGRGSNCGMALVA